MGIAHPTQYRFRQHRSGLLIWASGIGEVEIPKDSKEYRDLIHDQLWTPNQLVDEGEQNILEVYFRAATAPTTFFLRLVNDTPVDTDSLGDLTGEPSTNGYAAQEVTRDATGWPTTELHSGDWRVKTGTENFVASGGSWGPVTHLILATTSNNTGLLVAHTALSATRTLQDGDDLDTDLAVKLA